MVRLADMQIQHKLLDKQERSLVQTSGRSLFVSYCCLSLLSIALTGDVWSPKGHLASATCPAGVWVRGLERLGIVLVDGITSRGEEALFPHRYLQPTTHLCGGHFAPVCGMHTTSRFFLCCAPARTCSSLRRSLQTKVGPAPQLANIWQRRHVLSKPHWAGNSMWIGAATRWLGSSFLSAGAISLIHAVMGPGFPATHFLRKYASPFQKCSCHLNAMVKAPG